MLKKPETCRGCALERIGAGFSVPGGAGRNGILLVGEALGADEVDAGTQFVGAAGKTLNRIIEQCIDPLTGQGLKREDFKTYNVIQCRPPDNVLVKAPYEFAAIEQCRPNLERVIGEFKPRAIVPLGNTAFRWFTGNTGIDSLRGYVYDTKFGPVIPTYHPSFIQRGNWHLARVVQLDILKALQVSREGKDVYQKEKHYALHPSPREALSFLEAYREKKRPALASDIETPYGGLSKDELMGEGFATEDDPSYTIERISFSFEPFKAITVPWTPPYDQFAKTLLKESPFTLFWNEAFDVPRLQVNGAEFNGVVCDAMHAWHFLEPSLPMGLKYVATFLCPDMPPWKLMSRESPEWYSAADSDVLLRCFLSIREQLTKQGRWNQFERHFLSLKLILNNMTKRGICVDEGRRKGEWEKLGEKLKTKLEKLQEVVPINVKPAHPKNGFKGEKESLMKSGSWEEGKMIQRTFLITEEEMGKINEKLWKKEEKARVKEEKKREREKKKEERRLLREEKERKRIERNNSNIRRVRRRSVRSLDVE